MKNKVLFFLFLSILFLSCQNDIINDVEPIEISSIAKLKSLPTNINDPRFIRNWEEFSDVLLTSNHSVQTPWNPVATGNFPREVGLDIKKQDGWKLLTNNNYDRGSDYLVFYNKYTGILKFFYYQEAANPNTGAVWSVYDVPKNGFLKQLTFLTQPIDYIDVQDTKTLSNIRVDDSKGLSKGWNVVQLPLTYTPKQDGYLDIFAETLDYSKFDFQSVTEGVTQGSILEIGKESKFNDKKITSFISKKTGSTADKWIKDQATKWSENEKKSSGIFGKLEKGIIDLLKNKGTNGLIEKGLNYMLGSFLGKIEIGPTPLNFTVELNTKSNTTGSGTIEKKQDGTINSLKIKTDHFGAWNLATAPTISIAYTKTEVLDSRTKKKKGTYESFQYYNPKYEVVVNPNILDEVSVSTSCKLVAGIPHEDAKPAMDYYKIQSKFQFLPCYKFNSLDVNQYFIKNTLLLSDSFQIYETSDVWAEHIAHLSYDFSLSATDYSSFNAYVNALMYSGEPSLKLSYKPDKNSLAIDDFGNNKVSLYPSKHLAVAVTVTFTIKKTGQKIISTRTFFPRYVFNW